MLLDEIEADPKITAARLRDIYRRHADRPGVERELAEGVASGSRLLERAGSALLRLRAAELGKLEPEAWAIVVEGLDGLKDWAGRLQVCQILAEQPQLLDAAPDEFARFTRSCAEDANTFVRAWGVTAFHELGRRHPEHRAAAKRVVAKARRDPAPAMRARLKRLPT